MKGENCGDVNLRINRLERELKGINKQHENFYIGFALIILWLLPTAMVVYGIIFKKLFG